ncbi:phenylcoumaran benzylic ether reductase TP7-like [Eucalyptus grandis]|uniref:phenylcoumaran benzylic ether reductase TP7-like n=1 Tax=Eucalyptus grandis TaxID=71139 RepID=UPI00192EDE2A|nr:phenylcoumaran benzylic ether reductase TP7-like [Eucalyptus grandis]
MRATGQQQLQHETKQVRREEPRLRRNRTLRDGEKSKVLVIGGTRYTGKFVVKVSAKSGHPTFALVRESALSDPTKAEMVEDFNSSSISIFPRFLPSDFGNDADRNDAVEPAKTGYAIKAKIRCLVEAEESLIHLWLLTLWKFPPSDIVTARGYSSP